MGRLDMPQHLPRVVDLRARKPDGAGHFALRQNATMRRRRFQVKIIPNALPKRLDVANRPLPQAFVVCEFKPTVVAEPVAIARHLRLVGSGHGFFFSSSFADEGGSVSSDRQAFVVCEFKPTVVAEPVAIARHLRLVGSGHGFFFSSSFADEGGSVSSGNGKFKPGDGCAGTRAGARDLFTQALTEAQEYEDAEASLFVLLATPGNAQTHHHCPKPDPSRRVRATDRLGPRRGFADPGEEIERAIQDPRLEGAGYPSHPAWMRRERSSKAAASLAASLSNRTATCL